MKPTLLLALLAAGCSSGPAVISASGAGAHEASLAATDDGLAVAWYDTRDGNAEIYMRLLDPRGRPAGPERRLTRDAEESYEADIAAFAGTLVIAWYDKRPDGMLRPHLGAWSADGQQLWRLAPAPAGRNPVVRASRRGVFCAWVQDEADGAASVWGGWWTHAGQPLVPPERLAPAGRTTWNLNADIDRYDTAWVVFDARAGTTSEELFLVGGGAAPVRLTADDGMASKYPDLDLSGGRAAITWFDERDGNREIYLAVVEIADLTRLEARAKRLTFTRAASIGAYLAWNGPVLGVAWSDATEGQNEIYAQLFTAGGSELGPAARLTDTAASSNIPAIEPWDDGFAIAWSEHEPAGEGHAPEGTSAIAFTMHP